MVVGVALFHLYIGGGNAQLLGKDLRIGRLVTLPLRLGSESRDVLARRMNANLAGVEHLQSQDVEVLGGAGPHDLGEARDADAHQLAPLPLLRLLAPELSVADAVHGLLE